MFKLSVKYNNNFLIGNYIKKTMVNLKLGVFIMILMVQLSTANMLFQHNQNSFFEKISTDELLGDDLIDVVLDEEYSGLYQTNTSNLFNYLSSRKGKIFCAFYKENAGSELMNLGILFLDPDYIDEKIAILRVKNIKIDHTNDTWEATNLTLNYFTKYKDRLDVEDSVKNVDVEIALINLREQDYEKVEVQIYLESKHFEISSRLKYNDLIMPSLGYCIFLAAVVGVQIYCAFVLLKQMEGALPGIISKISLLTLSLCNIQDFSMTLDNIQNIMSSDSGYLFFILPSMAYIILFVIFDMKMLFLVWRNHNMRYLEDPQMLRKKLTTFYIQFYIGLFLFLTLEYFFSLDSWLIILRNAILIPQIIHNCRIGNNPGFYPVYLFGYIGTRQLIPLYERWCPNNRFNLAPSTFVVLALLILFALEILLLFLQHKCGSRFFIPKSLQPNYFNYNSKVKMNEQNKEDECSICLMNIFSRDISSSIITDQNSLDNDLLAEVEIMATPCNHRFHKQCLTEWLDVKLECPSCRKQLPPIV